MAFFGITRRITERTIRRKLFSPPPRVDYGISNKEKLLKKEATEVKKNKDSNIKGLCVQRSKLRALTTNATSNDLITDRNHVTHHKVFDISDIKLGHTIFKPYLNVKWFAKTRNEKGGPVRRSGGRFGKLGAANEAGFFHKTDRERLMELRRKLKDKEKGPDAPKQI